MCIRPQNMCHGTTVSNLSAPVRLLRPHALVTIAPPFFRLCRAGMLLNRLPTLPGTVNDILGMSLVTSYGDCNDVTGPSQIL